MVVDSRPANACRHRRADAGRRRASLAASPPVAGRLGLDPFYFVNRHILFLLPSIAVMLGVSFLNPHQVRRLSLLIFVISLILVAATPFFGPEIKGARRWLILSGISIQP